VPAELLHVTTRDAWDAAFAAGAYAVPPGPDGAPAPFTHCCRADQLAGVVARFYPPPHTDLVVLHVDADALEVPVVVEAADDGAGDFPHVYGPIPVGAVTDVHPLRDELAAASVRRAGPADTADVGHMHHDFNAEFEAFTPGAQAFAERYAELMATEHLVVLVAGDGPDGFVVLRFRGALATPALECYVAELYVRPQRRGERLGRALMLAAIETARAEGADHMDLGTSEDDTAARGLYESLGFRNWEGPAEGPRSLFYEREL
jgi:uncharacterized protein (DUF952 family)/ribosomal protein S18 acetylase RimI-like enzyme